MNHNVAHLKSFGCVAYTHILDELRKKLDNKGHKCIFDGYSEDTKGHKLYELVAKKFIISPNDQFVENESWDGSITKTIRIIDVIEHDDTKEEVVKTPCTSQCTVPSATATQSQHKLLW
jgi:hypothetical protein